MSNYAKTIAAAGLLLLLGMVALPFIYTSGSRPFQELGIPAEGYEIKGYLSRGTDPNGVWVIFVHGNREQGQAHKFYQWISNNLTCEVSVLAIDLRGFGQSPVAGLALSNKVLDRSGDIEAAVAYLEKTYGAQDGEIILMGHSLGAVQVLKAGQERRYRLLVPIGPGDFEAFITDRDRMHEYISKFERNTGIALTPEAIIREGAQLTPQALFSPCPKTPAVLVFGTYEYTDSLSYHRHKIPDNCDSSLRWITIPFSDHFYGTEGAKLPEPLQSLFSMISLSMLKWELNHLLKQSANMMYGM